MPGAGDEVLPGEPRSHPVDDDDLAGPQVGQPDHLHVLRGDDVRDLVVQYRDRILPLVPLQRMLEPGAPDTNQLADPVQVIVFKDDDRSVGLMVDQIIDVAEEAVTVRQKSSRKGLLGSAVVGKLVTDFLDLSDVIQSATENWLQGASALPTGKRILVAEASAFSRGLIRSGLDMAGYRVVEAATLDEAIRGLEQEVDAVMAGLDLPPNGCAELLAQMQLRPEWKCIPVLALAESAGTDRVPPGFGACVGKFDREAMLESLAHLASALVPAGSSAAGIEESALQTLSPGRKW